MIIGFECLHFASVLQCIKKNGSSLEHLELSRSSLLRMDPLRSDTDVISSSGINLINSNHPQVPQRSFLRQPVDYVGGEEHL